MIIKVCVTFMIIAAFALFFAMPLAEMADDNEECKPKKWFVRTLSLLFALFLIGAIGTVVFGILAIWI